MFRLAENYPVDLYFVMDLSNSMDDDKKKLAELGDLLGERLTLRLKGVQVQESSKRFLLPMYIYAYTYTKTKGNGTSRAKSAELLVP